MRTVMVALVAIVLQYVSLPNQEDVHFKLIQCSMSIMYSSLKKAGKKKKHASQYTPNLYI